MQIGLLKMMQAGEQMQAKAHDAAEATKDAVGANK